MSQRFPNANYPEAYTEADMAKAGDVATNADGGKLTIEEAGAGLGPLLEHSRTGSDVKGLSFRDGTGFGEKRSEPVVEESATEEDV
jgi:hypothetical protein